MREWLIRRRMACNLTQAQIASEIKISQSHYSFIESGERNPSIRVAKQLGQIFNVRFTQFYDNVL